MLKTFANDEDLPSLPLPNLEDTLSLYIESVEALTDEIDTSSKIHEFKKDPDLKQLHDELLQRSQEKKNWVSNKLLPLEQDQRTKKCN